MMILGNKMSKIVMASMLAFMCSVNAKVLVNVDGLEVTDSMANLMLKQQGANVTYDGLTQEQKQQVLDGLIANALIVNAAKKEGLDKSDIYKMATNGILTELWQQKQLESVSKTLNVSDSEAQSFYNSNKQLFVAQNASVRHILVAKEDQAKNIIAEIAKVPKTKTEDKFAELAKKNSLDEASKAQGGLMENINVNMPQLAPEFAAAVKGMSAGTYTKTPIKTQFGYHVIYLKKLDAPQTLSYDKAKPQIINGLKQQKFLSILEEKVKKMRDNAKITYGK